MRLEREILFVPRSPLGRKLVALRNKAISSGMRLFSEKEVLEELKRRRGAFMESDDNGIRDK
jgi:hypothetical protein